MPDKWPSLYEQLGAVTAAPTPFFIALIVIAWIAWRALAVALQSRLSKSGRSYPSSQDWKWITGKSAPKTHDGGKRRGRSNKSSVLQRPAAAEDVNARRAQIDQLKQTISRLTSQLNALGQANSSAASTGFAPGRGQLSGIPPPPAADWTSSGWKPRNPK